MRAAKFLLLLILLHTLYRHKAVLLPGNLIQTLLLDHAHHMVAEVGVSLYWHLSFFIHILVRAAFILFRHNSFDILTAWVKVLLLLGRLILFNVTHRLVSDLRNDRFGNRTAQFIVLHGGSHQLIRLAFLVTERVALAVVALAKAVHRSV